MNDPSTFPSPTMGGSWAEHFDLITDLPCRGDTVVGNDVWFGYGVTVMPGVRIGHGAIITAGAVVTGDLPNHGVAGGNPARLIRTRYDAAGIARPPRPGVVGLAGAAHHRAPALTAPPHHTAARVPRKMRSDRPRPAAAPTSRRSVPPSSAMSCPASRSSVNWWPAGTGSPTPTARSWLTSSTPPARNWCRAPPHCPSRTTTGPPIPSRRRASSSSAARRSRCRRTTSAHSAFLSAPDALVDADRGGPFQRCEPAVTPRGETGRTATPQVDVHVADAADDDRQSVDGGALACGRLLCAGVFRVRE